MIRRRVRRFLCGERGASAVEFALVAVPLLAIIFGTIEYGRLMWTRQALQESATAGARCIGVAGPACTNAAGAYDAARARLFVRSSAQGWFVALDDADITVENDVACGGVSHFARVSIRHGFSTPVPEFLIGLTEGTQLSASACFPRQAAGS
jgi:hypothetical protein